MTIQQLNARIDEMKTEKREIERERSKLKSQIAELQQTENGTLPML